MDVSKRHQSISDHLFVFRFLLDYFQHVISMHARPLSECRKEHMNKEKNKFIPNMLSASNLFPDCVGDVACNIVVAVGLSLLARTVRCCLAARPRRWLLPAR
jgi:hypothetical protein